MHHACDYIVCEHCGQVSINFPVLAKYIIKECAIGSKCLAHDSGSSSDENSDRQMDVTGPGSSSCEISVPNALRSKAPTCQVRMRILQNLLIAAACGGTTVT